MDMSPASSIFIATAVLVGLGSIWLWKKKMAECPGPMSFPLLGNIPQVLSGKMDFNKKLIQLRKKFGDFFKLNMGNMTTVFVFGTKNVSEILIRQGENFIDRPNWLFIPDRVIGRKGLTWSNGKTWKYVRSLVVQTQHNSSCASHIETEILNQIEDLCQQLKPEAEKLTNPYQHFRSLAFDILSSFIFGSRFVDDDFRYMSESIDFLKQNNKTQNPVNMFPWISILMKSKHASAIGKEAEVFNFISKQIDKHKRVLDSNHPKDLIDIYLIEKGKLSDEEQKHLETNFLRTIIDLYIYGFEMSTSALLWIVAMLIKNPDVQRKCHEEISKIFPDGELRITCEDRKKLPYCYATLKEVTRMVGPGIMTAPHEATEDTIVSGYKINSHQLIVCDLMQPRFDEEEWANPHEFLPERFIDSSEDLTNRAYSTFGLGPRKCPAQKFSEDMQFLVMVNLLRHFRLEKDYDIEEFNVNSEYKGVSYKPEEFQMIFKLKSSMSSQITETKT